MHIERKSTQPCSELQEKFSASTISAVPFTLTAKHPSLTDSDAALICIFLWKYKQYRYEAASRAHKMSSSEQTKMVRAVDKTFCVDVGIHDSSIDSGFTSDSALYGKNIGREVRRLPRRPRKDVEKTILSAKLDKIVIKRFSRICATPTRLRKCSTCLCKGTQSFVKNDWRDSINANRRSSMTICCPRPSRLFWRKGL